MCNSRHCDTCGHCETTVSASYPIVIRYPNIIHQCITPLYWDRVKLPQWFIPDNFRAFRNCETTRCPRQLKLLWYFNENRKVLKAALLHCIISFGYQKTHCSNGGSSSIEQKKTGGKEEVLSEGLNQGGWSQNFFGRPGGYFIMCAVISEQLRLLSSTCKKFFTAAALLLRELKSFCSILCKKIDLKFERVT